MSTFVSAGNATQPFMRLLEAVRASASELPQPVIVQYGSGQNIFAGVCVAQAFMNMTDFAAKVAVAELLVIHGGAGSIIHAIRAGKVPVVVPRRPDLGEHIDGHQIEFAHELARSGKIVLCADPAELVAAARKALCCQQVSGATSRPPRITELVREALLRAD